MVIFHSSFDITRGEPGGRSSVDSSSTEAVPGKIRQQPGAPTEVSWKEPYHLAQRRGSPGCVAHDRLSSETEQHEPCGLMDIEWTCIEMHRSVWEIIEMYDLCSSLPEKADISSPENWDKLYRRKKKWECNQAMAM